MSESILKLTDFLLFGIHILLISINMFGWIFIKTRKIQLVTILSTTFSWFVMGIWYGWGYCFLTDWEWSVKRDLGEYNLPHSFIHYLANNILRLNLNSGFLDNLTVVVFVFALIAGIVVNLKGYRKHKKSALH